MVVLEIIRTHAEPLNYETVKLITDERRESFFLYVGMEDMCV